MHRLGKATFDATCSAIGRNPAVIYKVGSLQRRTDCRLTANVADVARNVDVNLTPRH